MVIGLFFSCGIPECRLEAPGQYTTQQRIGEVQEVVVYVICAHSSGSTVREGKTSEPVSNLHKLHASRILTTEDNTQRYLVLKRLMTTTPSYGQARPTGRNSALASSLFARFKTWLGMHRREELGKRSWRAIMHLPLKLSQGRRSFSRRFVECSWDLDQR